MSEFAWALDDRLGGAGARKGRVLAIWQGRQVVAACCWHLEDSGPPAIFDLCCRSDLEASVADSTRAILLLCLRDIAHKLGRSTTDLYWTTMQLDHMPDDGERKRAKGANRKRASKLRFERSPTNTPKWAKKHWIRARRF